MSNDSTAIAIQLAETLDDGWQKERDASESITDYLNESGSLMSLGDHLGDTGAPFVGLAYEIASACAGAQSTANGHFANPEEVEMEKKMDVAKRFLVNEFGHIQRELDGTTKALSAD
jgi:hypothetical protein